MPSQDPTPLQATQQASYQPASIQDDADAKIGHIKYWGVGLLIIISLSIVSTLLVSIMGNSIYNLVWVAIGVVLVYRHTSKLKRQQADVYTQSDKYKSVMLMFFNLIIGQAIYYFRLRSKLPNTAKKLNKIGWKIIAIFFSIALLGSILATALLSYNSISKLSWFDSSYDAYKNGYSLIGQDIKSIGNAFLSRDTTSVGDSCDKLKTDIDTFRDIKQYPDKDIQNSVTAALDELDDGAQKCTNAMDTKDTALLSETTTILTKGTGDLLTVSETIASDETALEE